MCKKRKGIRANRTTRRRMHLWGHYKFQQRLKATAETSGVTVGIVDESYTSKTCGQCGILNDKLGGAKTFRCPHCGHEEDRDMGAARKIILRSVSAA